MNLLSLSTRIIILSFILLILTGFFLSPGSVDTSNCGGTSTGFSPLNELGSGLYKGAQGGLYPDGSNNRPKEHEQAGLALVESIRPLNSAGNVDSVNGKVVLLSIGLSNTTQEYRVFMELANDENDLNPRLQLVDGAQGGQAAEDVVDPDAPYWNTVATRIRNASVTAEQVQAVWLKTANRSPNAPFPDHAESLQSQITQIMHNLTDKFPNLMMAYISSRIYAGYASTQLNPEPYAYESGFAVKWLIEAQIDGDPELNFDPTREPVRAPWLSWGPYLWADGLVPRADGLIWECRDFIDDGTHPSEIGRTKVARMLLDFFKNDETTRGWFSSE